MRFSVPALLLLLAGPALAAPPCDAPPYGSDDAGYRSWMNGASKLFNNPDTTLAKLCKAKYGQISRAGLHNIGITDTDIDSKDTVDLGIQFIKASKDFLDKEPSK